MWVKIEFHIEIVRAWSNVNKPNKSMENLLKMYLYLVKLWKCSIEDSDINWHCSYFLLSVILSSARWNEWILCPNFGFRLLTSSYLRFDTIAILSVVRLLWFTTDRIVFAKNRLLGLWYGWRIRWQLLGPNSPISFDAFSESWTISLTACLALNDDEKTEDREQWIFNHWTSVTTWSMCLAMNYFRDYAMKRWMNLQILEHISHFYFLISIFYINSGRFVVAVQIWI